MSKEPCPYCDDVGWTVEYETRCCGGSDWECGARGCTGPIQEQVQVECPCGAYRTLAKDEEKHT